LWIEVERSGTLIPDLHTTPDRVIASASTLREWDRRAERIEGWCDVHYSGQQLGLSGIALFDCSVQAASILMY
jgi:hypothetical protein